MLTMSDVFLDIICDGCGQEFERPGNEGVTCYNKVRVYEMRNIWQARGWLVAGKKAYCPECRAGIKGVDDV